MSLTETDIPWLPHHDPGARPGEGKKARAARETQERFIAKQAAKAEALAAADKRRLEIRAAAEQAEGKRRIEMESEPGGIRALKEAIDAGALAETYVRSGNVVVIEEPSGSVLEDDDPPETITLVEPAKLDLMLAEQTFCYKPSKEKLEDGRTEIIEKECSPTKKVALAVLSSTVWPNLRPLRGIITVPTLRPDGSLVQVPGYDEATEMFYSPALPLPFIPDEPTAEQVAEAKDFILDKLLADFPWVGPSRANYLGMMISPLMRTYLNNPIVPLLAVDATSPATGKTLLALILIRMYSGIIRPWVADDTELRKAVTSILIDNSSTVVNLDNVGKGDVVEQPTLSMMLTGKTWSDRILGVSGSVKVANNRLWIVTGNSLTVGGDVASRTVLVRLDTGEPNPELRPASGFALGNLEDFLADPQNRATVMFHLLILVRAWVNDGAHTVETPMRSFTPFASAAAGFVAWLGEPGFLSNAAALMEVDEEESAFGAFYARWHQLYAGGRLSTTQLVEAATPDAGRSTVKDWQSTFPVRKRDGQIPSAAGLGKILASERGRHRGGFRLNGFWESDTKVWRYSVTPSSEPKPADAR